MRAKGQSAARAAGIVALGFASLFLLACIIPAAVKRSAAVLPTPTEQALSPTAAPTLAPSAAPAGTAQTTATRVSEQQLNEWMKGAQTNMGEGMTAKDMHMAIRSSGLTLSANIQVQQLRGAVVPVEILLKPVVRDDKLAIEVQDVRLGGAYASFSGLIRPLVSSGMGQAFDANGMLAERGVRVVSVELQDGYMVVTTAPAP
jgi:hypothetical protein